MSKELRQFPRQKIQIEVALNYLEDEPRTLITRNLSDGGMFLRLNDASHYTMGEMVSVSYKDPLHDYAATEKDAIIVRHDKDGIAIAFIEIEEF